MKKKLLVKFKINNRTFAIFGSYGIKHNKELYYENEMNNWFEFDYPEFYDLIAKEIINTKFINFEPTKYKWSGAKYNVEDMISSFMACLTMKNIEYENLFIDAGLEKMIKHLNEVVLTENGININKYIFTCDFQLHQLSLVTNNYIYYGIYDEYIMLSTDNHNIVSDNYFAEVGLWDSIENIKNGKEKLLWGNLENFEE